MVNDPAASSAAGVRRTYDRGQFEDVWLRRGTSGSGGSGGLVYVVHDAAHPLPDRKAPQLVSTRVGQGRGRRRGGPRGPRAQPARPTRAGSYSAVNSMVCQPVAPSGTTSRCTPVWV